MFKDSKEKVRVIYIAGYGHSGSTIMETLLCCPDEIVGLGELVGIPRELNASFTQIFLEKNPFCADLYQRIQDKLERNGESFHSISELSKYENILRFRSKAVKERYDRYWSTFLNVAKNDPSKNIKGFVDSSKTSFAHARRPYYLQENSDIEVAMVHIVRHPKAILWRLKGKAVKLRSKDEPKWISEIKQVIITTLNWTFSNIWPALFSHKVDKYVRISFEELCEFPVETLKKIGKNCNLDLSETIERVKNNRPLPPTCGIAGNIPVKKREDELRFQPSKKVIPETGFFLSILSVCLIPIYKILTR